MKKIFGISGLILLGSCSSSIKGKIEYRNDDEKCYYWEINTYKYPKTNSAYLINNSTDKAYEFTIKEIETIDDTIVNYSTFKIKLSPGDEHRIGCIKFSVEKIHTEEVKDTVAVYQNDTIIAPEKRIVITYKYSCTGQRQITNQKELDELK